jgi:hypothetical protein
LNPVFEFPFSRNAQKRNKTPTVLYKGSGQGGIKQTSRLQKNVINPKNGLRPKNRGKQKQNRGRGVAAEPTKSMDLRTRMLNCHQTVLPKSVWVWGAPFVSCFEAPGAKQTKSTGREANTPQGQGLAFASLGLPCFLLASGRRRKK